MAKSKNDSGEKKLSQMGMVRAAMQDMGTESKPQEMQAHIKSKYNVELPANIISNYKSQIKRKNGGSSNGRGRRGGLQIEDIESIKGLVRRLGADQVKRLADAFE